jgi:hypothetical protein
MENHKDKFISKLIYSELETLEVKRNGRVEHKDGAHDDQVFSMLMALYVWYEGKNLMDIWGFRKESIKTDEDIDMSDVEVGFVDSRSVDITRDILMPLGDEENGVVDVKSQIDWLNTGMSMTYGDWHKKRIEDDRSELYTALQNPMFKEAYERHYKVEVSQLEMMRFGSTGIPMSAFMEFYDDSDVLNEDESFLDKLI